MTKAEALATLRAREPELRAMGIKQLSIFGSVARGEQTDGSDVDLAAEIDYEQVRTLGPFGYFAIERQIAVMLGTKVDFGTEPHDQQPRLQAQIDRDRVRVF